MNRHTRRTDRCPRRRTRCPVALGVLLGLLSLLTTESLAAQEATTIFFDNRDGESGITSRGTREFEFAGSRWSGGVVETESILPLYASGSFSYEMEPGGGEVAFDVPIASVRFFFVHGFGFPPGTARALDESGQELGTVESRAATNFADPDNFVEISSGTPIARVTFSGGVVDNFTFTPTVVPGPLAERVKPGSITIELEEMSSGLFAPVMLTHAGDGSDRLFVVDQAGMIRIIDAGGQLLEEPFLDLRDRMVALHPPFDERGLLGLAFHPDYANNGRFFVRYSEPREGAPDEPCSHPNNFIPGCHTSVLSEFRASNLNPDRANPDSETVLLRVDQPEANHNAGHLAFGPDGMLYVSFGDGGGQHDGLGSEELPHGPTGHGQNLDTLLGTLLRLDVGTGIDPPFTVPPDNPFVGVDGDDRIYAYGFRNPYRFSFDREGTNELIVADVGQNLLEELDIIEPGGNYGWVLKEGSACFDPEVPETPLPACDDADLIDPFAEYGHDDGLAIIGGYVYRGDLVPELEGHYVFGDFSLSFGGPDLGRLFYLDFEGDRSEIFEFSLTTGEPLGLFLLGFGEDEDGELYVLTSATGGPLGQDGQVFRIRSSLPEGQRVPGDCNGDGSLDISDAICTFEVLFTGTRSSFPCDDGPLPGPGSTLLMDWQPDGAVDLSDGIAMLRFLFLGGPAHPRALPGEEITGCVTIPGCPDAPACAP